jgi:hypothetical protein
VANILVSHSCARFDAGVMCGTDDWNSGVSSDGQFPCRPSPVDVCSGFISRQTYPLNVSIESEIQVDPRASELS